MLILTYCYCQRFLTGLLPPISRQLLIHGKPKTLDEAIKGAVQVEFGLEFGSTRVPQDASYYTSGEKEGVASATGLHSIQEDSKLQKTMEELAHRLGNLEVYVKRSQQQPRYNRRNGGRRRPIQDRKCWVCGEEGHFQRSCPLKLPRASPAGGRLATEVNNHSSSGVSLNAVFYVKGMIGTSPTKFLLDTGAAMSALCWDILPEGYRNQMESVHSKAVGANGLPLEVVGQVTVAISVGGFT